MPHPDEGLIHAWLDGELDATEAARVEALVASDPAWAAAVAEARALIAASARIVGTLDRVPANVIPRTAAAPRRAARQWVWRVAAVLALMAGSAVVLERRTPELTAPKAAEAPLAEQASAPAASAAPAAPEVSPRPGTSRPAAKKAGSAAAPTRDDSSVAAAPVLEAEPGVAGNAPVSESRSSFSKKALDIPKQTDAFRDKDAASALGELRANMAAAAAAAGAAAGAGRRAAFTTPAVSPSPVFGAPPAPGQALEKTTRLQPYCFEQRQPRDSATRIIRLDSGALADSIRLERLTLRGDTLAAVHGRLTAVRVRCPQP
jgi:hypothetical protein